MERLEEVMSERRQSIAHRDRYGGLYIASNEAALFETPQAVRQDLLAHAVDCASESCTAHLPVIAQLAQDEHGPAVADEGDELIARGER